MAKHAAVLRKMVTGGFLLQWIGGHLPGCGGGGNLGARAVL